MGVVIPVAGHPFNPGVAIPDIIAVLTIPFAVELIAVAVTTAAENVGDPSTWPGVTHAVCTSITALPAVDEE